MAKNRNPSRLSDTEALVREGVNRPGPKVAPLHFGEYGADNAVLGHQPGRFRRETNAGGESLSGACREICK